MQTHASDVSVLVCSCEWLHELVQRYSFCLHRGSSARSPRPPLCPCSGAGLTSTLREIEAKRAQAGGYNRIWQPSCCRTIWPLAVICCFLLINLPVFAPCYEYFNDPKRNKYDRTKQNSQNRPQALRPINIIRRVEDPIRNRECGQCRSQSRARSMLATAWRAGGLCRDVGLKLSPRVCAKTALLILTHTFIHSYSHTSINIICVYIYVFIHAHRRACVCLSA